MRLSKLSFSVCMLAALLMLSACSDFFTTSLASGLARSIDYSSLSLDQLLSLATTRGVTSSVAAKEILAALADYSESELKDLSVEEKETILNTAINATLDLDSVLNLVDSVSDENVDSVLEQIYELVDSDVDTTAISVILQDEDTLNNADVDTIILAAAAYVISEASSPEDIDTSLVTSVVSALENRDDLSDSMLGGYLDTILGAGNGNGS